MINGHKDNNLFFTDGDQWESFCHTCLKHRHQNDNYKPVDAVSYKPIDEKDKGDYGLDGYTATGIAYQCYLPENKYSKNFTNICTIKLEQILES